MQSSQNPHIADMSTPLYSNPNILLLPELHTTTTQAKQNNLTPATPTEKPVQITKTVETDPVADIMGAMSEEDKAKNGYSLESFLLDCRYSGYNCDYS